MKLSSPINTICILILCLAITPSFAQKCPNLSPADHANALKVVEGLADQENLTPSEHLTLGKAYEQLCELEKAFDVYALAGTGKINEAHHSYARINLKLPMEVRHRHIAVHADRGYAYAQSLYAAFTRTDAVGWLIHAAQNGWPLAQYT